MFSHAADNASEKVNIHFSHNTDLQPSDSAKPAAPRVMRRRKREELYAALDLGTNNCRLLIARPARGGRFRIVDSYSHIVRLGEGLARTGILSEAAMARALKALEDCRDRLDRSDIVCRWLVTTEACRKAENGAEFVGRVREQTGLELDIVDRATEARLAVSGCGALVDARAEAVVLFDIGGGSSEIALLDIAGRQSPRLAEHIVQWISLPVGVVTLAEQFGAERLTEGAEIHAGFAAMKAYVSGFLADFAATNSFRHLKQGARLHLLGASGTVTMLAGVALKLPRYDRKLVDGLWLGSAAISKLVENLLNMSMQEKLANPCIGPGRADLILAGCAIMEAIRSLWPQADVRVADRGLREGILTELMMRGNAWPRRGRGSFRDYGHKGSGRRVW